MGFVHSLVAVFIPRREPFRGPVMTPGEVNADYYQDQVMAPFDERLPQSLIPARPSRERVAFFLAPVEAKGFADDFLSSKEKHVVPFKPGIPPGRLSIPPLRRNIARPVAVPYGSSVPELDGVAPYGLE